MAIYKNITTHLFYPTFKVLQNKKKLEDQPNCTTGKKILFKDINYNVTKPYQ